MEQASNQNLQPKNNAMVDDKQRKKLCPNCHQYKLVTNRSRLLMLGWMSLFLTGLMTVFIITIIVAPFFLATALLGFVAAIFAKGGSCANCHYKFKTLPK